MNITPKKSLAGTICSYPQALLLMELGIIQHSYFYWIKTEQGEIIPVEGQLSDVIDIVCQKDFQPVSAFAAEDLIRMLGSVACGIQMDAKDWYSYVVHYKDPIDGMLSQSAASLPDALAVMLIYLLERKKKALVEANRWLESTE